MKNTICLLLSSLALAGCSNQPASSGPVLVSSLAPTSTITAPLPFEWPPRRGAAYPNVTLRDHTGETVELSSFAGKVLLIEPVGMT